MITTKASSLTGGIKIFNVCLFRKSSILVSNENISPVFTNRNPRNLEKMRIGYKPSGYHLEKPGRCFWHKLNLTETGRYLIATVEHFENGQVLKASTSEWALKKQLYRCKDTAAYINLGRVNIDQVYAVLAQRCLQSGITEIFSTLSDLSKGEKLKLFAKALEDGGVRLQEPPQYKNPHPWDQQRPEKPWEVIE